MAQLTIVPLQSTHWPHVTALLAQNGLPLDGLEEHTGSALVALVDGEVVGAAALELYGTAALLRSVAVSPTRQGQGIGARLVDATLALAQQHGVAELYLLTETAAPYFARRGFAAIARHDVAPAVTASVEFTSACPASAQAMRLALAPQPS